MRHFIAQVLVTYSITAESEAEAREMLSNSLADTEFPFFPHDKGSYESEAVVSITEIEQDEGD